MKTKQSTVRRKTPQRLDVFLQGKKKQACPVCKLPAAVQRQMERAKDRRAVTLGMVLEWLQSEWGITLTRKEYMQHHWAGHAWRNPGRAP